MASELIGAGQGALAGAPLGPLGIAAGGALGLLSGIFGNSAAEQQRKMEAASRAAEQRAAPYLAKAGASNGATTQVDYKQNGAGNLLQGALSGIQTAGNIQKNGQENDLRTAMMQKILDGQTPTAEGQQGTGATGIAKGLGTLSPETADWYNTLMTQKMAGL